MTDLAVPAAQANARNTVPVSETAPSLAHIGVTGLATMGRNLARNLARHGHVVALHNRTQARTDALIAQYGAEGAFVPSRDLDGSSRRSSGLAAS